MNRNQPPQTQVLDNLHILPPVRTTLPNGVPLSIINAGDQEVVRIDLLFEGGRWHQSQKLQALFTNRMLREGTRSYTATEIAEKLDYYGAWLELSSSSEHAFFTLYSLNKYIAQTIEVLESMIKEPLFPEKELSTVLENNVQQFLVNRSKVDFMAHRGLLAALYGGGHPCGQVAEEADYRQINTSMLRDFYQTHYHSGNCSIFLVGKVTDEVIHHVEKAFGTTPFGNCEQKPIHTDYSLKAVADKRIFIEHPDAMQSAVMLGATTLTRQNPDYLKLRVLISLFGGYFGSRLMTNIRQDKGYTYGISAGIQFYPDSGLLLISTETDNEYVEPLIKEVYREIDRLHNDPVSEAELSMVRNYMLGEMCRNYESPFSLSDSWIFIHTSHLDDSYFARSLQALKEVTPDELRELARRYFCKETLKEVIAGKKIT